MKVLQKKILVMTAVGVMLFEGVSSVQLAQASNVLDDTKTTTEVEKLIDEKTTLESFSLGFEGITLLEDVITDIITVEEDTTEDAVEESKTRVAKTREAKIKKEQIVIAEVSNYLNIRSKASENSKIVGKLYKDAIGTIIKEKNGWYQIKSGSVTGYVKGDYVLVGDEARKKADKVGERLATVTTTTLKLREKASTESAVLTLIGEGDELNVKKETKNWVKVKLDKYTGYVSKDYVEVYTVNQHAESIEEERIRLEQEEARRRQELAQQQAANNNATHTSNGGNSTSNSSANKGSSTSNSSSNSSSGSNSSTTSPGNKSLGQQIANYALQFKGNPYVYGGTSLTNGADCSGFVMSVYRKFGISLPRTSGAQASSGRRVSSIANAQPGDLIAYSGHIGIYIGNGRLVHASSPRTGIIVSNVNYRPIKSIRRIV